jgi:tetratricopeptide (TPR) repeat protein
VPLAIVLIAAALFRAGYFLLYRRSIFYDGLILDSSLYDTWARSVAAGDWIGSEAFYFPPLYPYLLGVLFRAFGHSYAPVYAAQMVLGLLNLILIYRIGLALFGSRTGLIAAAGAALYGPFAFYETKILGTALGLTLNLAALLLLLRAESSFPSRRPLLRWFLAGLAIGVASLCTPASVLLAILCAAAWAARCLRAPRARRPPGGLAVPAALLAGTLVALLPVLAHNLYVAGDPLLLSGQGGITFYQGNNARAKGLYDVVAGFSGSPDRQPNEEKQIAERETGRTLRRSEISAHFLRKGLAFIAASPGPWLALEVRKIGYLMGDYEASTEYSIYLERDWVPWLRVAVLPFAVIAGTGAVGLIGRRRALRRERPGTALILYTLYAAAVPMLFYVSSRYRLPLVPALLIYGASFVDSLVRQARERGAAGVMQDPAVVAALLVALVSFFPLGGKSVTAEANVHYNIGSLMAERGRHEEALVEYDRSLADWPTNTFALINRGNSLDKLGRPDEALESYRRAEEANPKFWKAYTSQGIVLRRQKRLDEEAEVYRRGLGAGGVEAQLLLGTTLDALGRHGEAVEAFRQASRARPGEARFQNALGAALEKQGDVAGAIEAYRAAGGTGPRLAQSRYNLAALLQGQGRVDEAVAFLEEAVRLDPRYARAHSRLGEIYAGRGDATRARDHFRLALEADPADAAALRGMARLGS